jgi:allophanate hydrolase
MAVTGPTPRTIAEYLAAVRGGASVRQSIAETLDQLSSLDDPAILIGAPLTELALSLAGELAERDPTGLPLHGVPFVVKDNIDVAGVPTTAACPSRATLPTRHATVVERLIAAGAVPVAKTNLDQFATGLVGTRSPLGTPRNPFRADVVPGGSSSGSAVAVARALVPFALGTDTAGSGRVPAAMCGLVGYKPTRGRLSNRGVVPAVARLDCVSVLSTSVSDGALVASLAEGFDVSDPWARRRPERAPRPRHHPMTVGVVADWPGDVDGTTVSLYASMVDRLDKLGCRLVPVDLDPFLAVGRLLYGGAMVGERWLAFGDVLNGATDADPVVRSIVERAHTFGAVDAYRDEHAVASLSAQTAAVWDEIDALFVPTTPGIATLTEVAADPIAVNAWLGMFTTFVNLLDLAAVAVPMGLRPDGVPAGVQVIGPAWSDDDLAELAASLLEEPFSTPVRSYEVEIVVVGAHLSGMPLNGQLTDLGGRLVRATTTAPVYRLHALVGTVPPKPGMVRVRAGGAAIDVEQWALPVAGFGAFVAAVPSPLVIGTVELSDGTTAKGFLCEAAALEASPDISVYGGWRAYTAR